MSMVSGGVNVGSVLIIVSGGLAKNIVYTGGIGFSGSTDLSLLPLSYNVSTGEQNYTVWFEFANNKLRVAKNEQDPATTVTFTGLFLSGTDMYENNVLSVDSLVENTTNGGITLSSKVIMNGGVVNMGSSSSNAHDINIGTNSASGGRTINIGNTISGSQTILNGVIEMPTTAADTVSYNDTASITWTDVSSTARRIGKICHVAVKANVSTTSLIAKGTAVSFFSVTPTNKYTNSYLVTGTAFDANTNDIGSVISVPTTADFKLIMPSELAANDSTTVYASVTYIST